MGLISVVALTNFSPTIAQGPAIIESMNLGSEVVGQDTLEVEKEIVSHSNNEIVHITESFINDNEVTGDIPKKVVEKSYEWGVDPKLAKAIAFCESSNRHYTDSQSKTVLRGFKNSSDVGLFQINEKYHLEKSRELGYNIYDLDGNIDYAMWLMSNAGARHWRYSQGCWQNIK